MYSTIANNSFSYLLTLDEIRKALPDETRPSWVKITTITMVSSFIQDIDIKRLRGLFEEIGSYKMRRSGTKTEGFEWKLKPTTFYNQVTLTYHDTLQHQVCQGISLTVRSRWLDAVIFSIANVSSHNSFIFSKPFWV
jgi:hypothetical protein